MYVCVHTNQPPSVGDGHGPNDQAQSLHHRQHAHVWPRYAVYIKQTLTPHIHPVQTGVTIVPQWATPNLWPVQPGESSALYSIQTTVMIILTTGFTLGAIVGMILHLLMPGESSTAYLEADIAHLQRQLDEARSKESEWSISSEAKTMTVGSESQATTPRACQADSVADAPPCELELKRIEN